MFEVAGEALVEMHCHAVLDVLITMAELERDAPADTAYSNLPLSSSPTPLTRLTYHLIPATLLPATNSIFMIERTWTHFLKDAPLSPLLAMCSP